MKELKFEIGKKYKHVSKDTIVVGISMNDKNGVFTCHSIDSDGCCWSKDIKYNGQTGNRYCGLYKCNGWPCASIERLQSGEVIEVPE